MADFNKDGLTTAEAKFRLQNYGPNQIVQAKKLSVFLDFLGRFKNPLLIILIIGAVLTGFIGETVSASIIVFIVVFSVIIDFINTYKSQKAAEDLKKRVMITTTVIRDGTEQEVSLENVVPGDLVALQPGEIIPADGEVYDAKDFFVSESQLTGESFPVEKENGSLVYMGSSVNTGKAYMVVKETGSNTKFSHIAESLTKREEPTEFDRGIQEFSVLIMKITVVFVLFIFLTNTILRNDVFESLLFAAALAVGLTPELLPMIIALNLSKGSMAMAKHGVIVKKLSAIQNFGNMDILCTDKTGTLTEDAITLVKCIDQNGEESDDALLYAYVSSTYSSSFRSPLDHAIKEYKHLDIGKFSKIDEIPFDYSRRRDSVVVESEGKHVLVTKGATDEVVKACTKYGSSNSPLTTEISTKIKEQYESLSQNGFRILALAARPFDVSKKGYTREDEAEMAFIGFIAFLDPPKKDVKETLKELEEYGIEIKVLTGDNEFVTKLIAGEIQLNVKGVLLGAEISALTDGELAIRAKETTIFARVTSDQKERIIKVLRGAGHVVGFLGDGINDAPPLKAADVGISVNNAVDVAKDSADLILLNKSLHDLVNGVLEGRKTFSNTLKYLMMDLSSNFGNMFSLAGASLLLPFLPMTSTQILLNNLIYDSSQLAITTDNVDKSYLIRPQKFKIGFIKSFMIIFGPLSSVFDVITFFALTKVFYFQEGAFQTGWFLESIAAQTFVVYIIRTRKIPFLQSKPSLTLVIGSICAVAFAWILAFSPINHWFGFTAIGWWPVLSIILIVVSYLVTIEIVKHWFYSKVKEQM